MTHTTPITQRMARLGFQIMTLTLAGFMLVTLQATSVQAQWATSGNNINNTNSGNVGVGTSTPSEKLEVAGTVKSGGVTITGAPAEPNYVNGLFLGMNGTTATIDAVNPQVDFRDLVISSKNFRVSTWNGGSLVTGLFQNTNGNVGIGTTSPAGPIDVRDNLGRQIFWNQASAGHTFVSANGGNAHVSGNLYFNGSDWNRINTAAAGGMWWAGNDGTLAVLQAASGSNPVSAFNRPFFINTSGSVGIGTMSPLYSLDVNGGINGFRAKAATTSTNDAIATFENSSGIQAIFRGNGYLGIGTTAPGYKLDLQGGALNSSGGLCIAGDCKTAWSQVSSQWANSGSNISYSAGSVGIGTSSPGGRLSVTTSTSGNATLIVTPDGTNNYYAGNTHDGLLIDGSLTGQHGTYNGGNVRLFRIKAVNGSDSLVIGRAGEMTATPSTGLAGATLKLYPDASNSFYGGVDYDVLQIGGNQLNNHGTYTGKTVRLIHVTNAVGADAFVVGREGNASFGGNLTVAGTLNAKYQDVAEWVPSSQELAAGTVVVLDQTRSNQVIASSQAYDTRVAGVVSLQPGITLGENAAGKVLVATTGRVKVKVDATAGPIQVGDLLVTSEKEGMAKKSEPLSLGGVQIHRPGTLIGKALEPLEKGTGEILVLLSLQ